MNRLKYKLKLDHIYLCFENDIIRRFDTDTACLRSPEVELTRVLETIDLMIAALGS